MGMCMSCGISKSSVVVFLNLNGYVHELRPRQGVQPLILLKHHNHKSLVWVVLSARGHLLVLGQHEEN